jgi:hypothetical protein
MDFERGLSNLDNMLQRAGLSADSEEYLDFVGWQRQLRASVENERRYAVLGPQEQEHRERLLRELDRLALRYTKKSFLDLCTEKAVMAPVRRVARMGDGDTIRYDVFLSYSHRDKDWVHNWLLPRLEDADIRVCIDFRDFEPGAPSLTEMERAVLQSRKTLLVLTPDYLASEWTEFENILAQTLDPAARRRRLLPLLLKPCELPLRIRTLTYLDFTKPDRVSLQLDRLIAAIASEARPTAASPSLLPELMSKSPSVAQVTILLEGDVQEFTSSERERFVFALSRIVNVAPGQIRILHVSPGSVQVTLEMPEEAARLLVSMYLASDPALQTLRIAKVELRQASIPRDISVQKAATMDVHALLIGVGNYIHPRYANLPATVYDVQAIATILTDPDHCGYPQGKVQTITGEKATAANIRAAIESLAQSTTPQSTIFIYFSGHGGRALENGVWRAYLCPREADPDDLAHTAIPGDEFSSLLAAIPAQKMLVILDACHASGSADLKGTDGTMAWKAGLPDDYYEALSQGSGRVVIASSKEDQYSYVREQGDLSLFTWHLREALSGKAAVRGDGLIHVLDVFHYVNEVVQADEPRQVPILKVKDLDLNFPIALDRGGKGAGVASAIGATPVVDIREQIVRDPISGASALSEYLKTRPEWDGKRNEVDLKRADLERIQHDLDLV